MTKEAVLVPMVKPDHLDHSRSDLVMFAVLSALSEKLKLGDIQSVSDFRWRSFSRNSLIVFVSPKLPASNTSCKITTVEGKTFFMGTNPVKELPAKEEFKFFPATVSSYENMRFIFRAPPEWMLLINTCRAARACALFRIAIDTANAKVYTDASTSVIRKISLDIGRFEAWENIQMGVEVLSRRKIKDCTLATVRYLCGSASLTAEIVEEKLAARLGEA